MSCLACGEHEEADGFDECRWCIVEAIENDPLELECISESYRPTVLRWMAEVEAHRAKLLEKYAQPGFLTKRQAG